MPFYASHRVDDVVVVDPVARQVRMLARSGDGYADDGRSALLDLGGGVLEAAITWPDF